jgi:hypothetical protein
MKRNYFDIGDYQKFFQHYTENKVIDVARKIMLGGY